MRNSIIIPVLNEAANLEANIRGAQDGSNSEIIVVDGGSSDGTVNLARALRAKVLIAPQGRAKQMNAGAQAARGDVLLFMHADTRMPSAFSGWIDRILATSGIVAGAFRLQIDGPRRALRWIERMVNWRSRWLQMPYGDQAIFMTKATFLEIGGFPDLPIMEDFEIMRRLRRRGRIGIAPVPVITSSRRWDEIGVWKTTLINQVAIVSYLLGISPERISRWHRPDRSRPVAPEGRCANEAIRSKSTWAS